MTGEDDMDHVWNALESWAERLGLVAADPNPTYSDLDNRDGLT